jgi:hypothetical protein
MHKLVLKVMGIQVELGYHLVNGFNIRLQILLTPLNLLVPKHREESFDKLLTNYNIRTHFFVSTLELSPQHASLSLLKRRFHDKEPLPILICPES